MQFNMNNLEAFDNESSLINDKNIIKKQIGDNNILCIHCKRTVENGIRCMGICVSDNDY